MLNNDIVITAAATAKQLGLNENVFLETLNKNLNKKETVSAAPKTYTLAFLKQFQKDPTFSLGLKKPVFKDAKNDSQKSGGGSDSEWKSQSRREKEKLSSEEKNIREIRSTLNKIAPSTAHEIGPGILACIDDICFPKVVPLFFDKAVQDVKNREIIINLCTGLKDKFGEQFLDAIHTQCINEFGKKCVDSDDDELVVKYNQRKSGVIQLIPGLYSFSIIDHNTVLECLGKIPRVQIEKDSDKQECPNQNDIAHIVEILNSVMKITHNNLRKLFTVYYRYVVDIKLLNLAKSRTKYLVDDVLSKAEQAGILSSKGNKITFLF
jgi:hypothetical protein